MRTGDDDRAVRARPRQGVLEEGFASGRRPRGLSDALDGYWLRAQLLRADGRFLTGLGSRGLFTGLTPMSVGLSQQSFPVLVPASFPVFESASFPVFGSASFPLFASFPKKEPLNGLRSGDCRVAWPPGVFGLRSGERRGLCNFTFHGDGGGVAFGVQTWLSDLTIRLQCGHLPDMKLLPPTVEYLSTIENIRVVSCGEEATGRATTK